MYGQVSMDTRGSKPVPVPPRVEHRPPVPQQRTIRPSESPSIEQYAPVPQERATQPPETPRVKKQPPAPQERAKQPPVPQERATQPPVPQERATQPPVPQEKATQPPVPQERATEPPVPQERASQPPVPQERATQPPVPQERATQPPVPQGGAQQPHPLIYRANRPVITAESEKSFAYGPDPFPINRFNTSYGHMTNMTWCLVCRERHFPPYRDRFHYHTSLYRLQEKLLRRNIDVMACLVCKHRHPINRGRVPELVTSSTLHNIFIDPSVRAPYLDMESQPGARTVYLWWIWTNPMASGMKLPLLDAQQIPHSFRWLAARCQGCKVPGQYLQNLQTSKSRY